MSNVLLGLCVVFTAFTSVMSLFALLVLWEQRDRDS